MEREVLFTNDAVVFGLLMLTLGLIFYTSESKLPFFKKFYLYVPALLLCYFIPGLYNTFDIIDGENSDLYFVASRYLLPASLVLFTISVDLKEIIKLGPKAGIMFLTGTVGIILGGPFAIWVISFFRPDLFTGDMELWRGLSTVAGSWIGGGANQAAMLETFKPEMSLFTQMIAVDIIIANLWLGFLLYWSRKPQVIDKLLKADASQIEVVKERIEKYQAQRRRMPTFNDIMKMMGVAFGATGLAHILADYIAPRLEENYPQLAEYSLTSAFFWLVVIATTIGVLLSFTRVKNLEGAGAGKFASAFLYVLVATIGMQMNLRDVLDNQVFFAIGLIWILTHVVIMLIMARLIRAPFFFVAVGSQANVGGAASAPVVANAFHPSLVAVGVLLAVLGYAVGTYGAYLCGILMKEMSEFIVGFL